MSARRLRRGLAAVALVVGAPGALIVATAGPAAAVTFNADILTDDNEATCDPGDCSLREAIAAASANAGPDEVALVAAGTYQITIGALSHPAVDALTITGNGNSVNETAAANLLDAGGPVTVSDLDVLDGAEQTIVSANGAVDLTGVTVANAGGNVVGANGNVTITGSSLTSQGAVVSASGSTVASASTLTSAAGAGISCGGPVTLTDTVVTGAAGGVSNGAGVTATGGSIAGGAGDGISTGAAVTLTDTPVSGAGGVSSGGSATVTRSPVTATTGDGITNGAGVTATDSNISAGDDGISTGGIVSYTNGDIVATEIGISSSTDVSVTDADIVAGDEGISNGGTATLTRTSVRSTGGLAISNGSEVVLDSSTVFDSPGGGISSDVVNATNSTISGNAGFGISASASSLTYTTVVGNGDGGLFQLSITGSLSMFATVVGEPGGTAENCGGGFAITTFGYNAVDDASCGIGAGPGDLSNLAIPLELGPLVISSPGVHIPALTSPLVNRIPLAACQTAPLATGVTTDQRGITRPQAALCDIGAVEVVFPDAPGVTFTG